MTAPSQLFGGSLSHAGPWAYGRPAPGAHPVALAIDPKASVQLLRAFGRGRIAGTVNVITTPAPYRRVRLYHKLSGEVLREVVSDGSARYAFENINTRLELYVTAEDTPGTGAYNATIEDFVRAA